MILSLLVRNIMYKCPIIGFQFLIKPRAIESFYCFMASVLKLTEISPILLLQFIVDSIFFFDRLIAC